MSVTQLGKYKYNPRDFDSIVPVVSMVIKDAVKSLGSDLAGQSVLDLVADQLDDVPLPTLRDALGSLKADTMKHLSPRLKKKVYWGEEVESLERMSLEDYLSEVSRGESKVDISMTQKRMSLEEYLSEARHKPSKHVKEAQKDHKILEKELRKAADALEQASYPLMEILKMYEGLPAGFRKEATQLHGRDFDRKHAQVKEFHKKLMTAWHLLVDSTGEDLKASSEFIDMIDAVEERIDQDITAIAIRNVGQD